MSDVKLCVDCDWCDSNYDHVEEWTCHQSGEPDRVDPVNGVVGHVSEGASCSYLRKMIFPNESDAGLCNIDGRHWKAKGYKICDCVESGDDNGFRKISFTMLYGKQNK